MVIVKTFLGLRFQEAILAKVSELLGKTYRAATSEDESSGIDEYIGDEPVSIKPKSYEREKSLPESLEARVIFYEKKKNGLLVDFKQLASLFDKQG